MRHEKHELEHRLFLNLLHAQLFAVQAQVVDFSDDRI